MYEFFHILVFCDKFSRAKNLNRSHRKKIYRCEFSFQFQYIAVPNSFEFKAAPPNSTRKTRTQNKTRWSCRIIRYWCSSTYRVKDTNCLNKPRPQTQFTVRNIIIVFGIIGYIKFTLRYRLESLKSSSKRIGIEPSNP